MATSPTRRPTAVLRVLYVLAGAAIGAGVICLFQGCYLAWVLRLFGGIGVLMWAYWLRTGRGPCTQAGTKDRRV